MTFLCLIVSKITRITIKMVAIFWKWLPKWRIQWRDEFGNTFSGIYAPQNLYIELTLKALRLLVSEIDVLLWKWPTFCKMAFTMSDRVVYVVRSIMAKLLLKSTPHKTYGVKFEGYAPLIPPSHRRRGATTGFGENRHHRSDTASRF